MLFSYRKGLLAASFVFAASFATAAEGMSQLDFIRSLESAPSDAIVQYCHANAPEAKAEIDKGYAAYRSSLDAAVKIWVSSDPQSRSVMTAEISATQAKALKADASATSAAALTHIQQYNPHQYCLWVAGKLEATTPDSILTLLHEYEEQAAAKQRVLGKKP